MVKNNLAPTTLADLKGQVTIISMVNIMQLIADYGSNIAGLYRSQLYKIEQTVLG